VPDVLHANVGPGARGVFTTRVGGTSTGPWGAPGGSRGRNLAHHVGDDHAAVERNRQLTEAELGRPLIWMDQCHSARVAVLREAPPRANAGEVDAVVLHGGMSHGAGALVADCVPLLLAATHGRTVAAVHVGRAGLVAGIVAAVLAEFSRLGSPAPTLHASVGPSICGRCYEVPEALQSEVASRVAGVRARTAWGTPSLDIPAGVIAQLSAAGVSHIEHLARCTRTDHRFYSYRRDGRTGRFAGIVIPAGDDTP